MNLKSYKEKIETQKIKKTLFSQIIEKNPNGILFESLVKKNKPLSSEQIATVLDELEKEELILIHHIKNKKVPNRERIIIKVKDLEKYPIRETIQIGDTTIPRLMVGDLVGAEDWNSSFETIAEYINSIESKFIEEIERTTKEFWKSLITIFGVMLSMFALIIKIATTNTSIDLSEFSLNQIFTINFMQILPLCIILVIFLCLLKLFFK